MVGALGGAGATGGQRLRGPRVGGDPPPAARGLVHGPPHQGVPEAEPSRAIGGPHEVGHQQGVERRERGLLCQAGGGRGLPDVERVPGDRCALCECPGLGRKRGDLTGERRRNAARHPRADRRRGRRRPLACRAAQRLQVEGVAAALLVEARARGPPEAGRQQRIGGLRRERPELERPGRAVAAGRPEGVLEGRRAARPRGEAEQHAASRAPVEQERDDVGRGRVGPVDVVEQEGHGAVGGPALEQRPHRAGHPVALHGGRGRHAGGPAHLRQRDGQVRELLRREARESGRADLVDAPPEHVGPEGEGHVALQLRGPAGQHEVPALRRPPPELAEDA